jgi:hypothetical protein
VSVADGREKAFYKFCAAAGGPTTYRPVWKSKFYGAFVLNRRVVLHAIDATPARWRRVVLHAIDATPARWRGVVLHAIDATPARWRGVVLHAIDATPARWRRVVLHAIDATPARWRGDAGSSPLD